MSRHAVASCWAIAAYPGNDLFEFADTRNPVSQLVDAATVSSVETVLSVIKGCHADRTVTGPLKTLFARFARSSVPPKTGPIPREALEPSLYSSGITAQDVPASLRNSEWRALESRNSQAVLLSEFAKTETTSPLTRECVANLFNCRAENIRQIRHRALTKRKQPYRPLTLAPEQEKDVVRFIHERFQSHNSVTQRELLTYVEEKFAKTLRYGWMQRFLDRHKSQIGPTIVQPQEQMRLEVPCSYLDDYLSLIKNCTGCSNRINLQSRRNGIVRLGKAEEQAHSRPTGRRRFSASLSAK
jgi:hypothetical protein